MNAAGRAWTRSSSGILAGVCKGLAERFDVDVLLIRFALIVSVLVFGTGVLAYIILALSLPREDRFATAYDSRIMGVCSRFAKRFDLDVGLVRAGFLTLLFCTGGTIFLVYVIMWFILPTKEEQWKQNDSRS